MNVLYVTARFPYPPDRGDRLTGYQVIRALAARHHVTLLSFVDGQEPAGAREALAPFCERIETVPLSRRRSWLQAWLGLFSSRPSQVAYYDSPAMTARVRAELSRRPDAVFVQLFRMAPHLAGSDHPAQVLFLADSLALNLRRSAVFLPAWRRLGVAWERWRVARFEVAATRAFREAWVVSPVDRDDLIARGATNVRVCPHGVDERLFALQRRPAAEPRLVFLGNLSVPHNADAAQFAAREVLPRVRERRPDARLWLVGADPGPAVRALGELPGVVVTGALPDLAPMWEEAHLLVAPLRFSSGIQNKVLEAMAAGVPVVTTPAVADSMGTRDGELLRSAEGADGLARAALAVIADPEAHRPMTERARAMVRAECSWDALAREVERVAADTAR